MPSGNTGVCHVFTAASCLLYVVDFEIPLLFTKPVWRTLNSFSLEGKLVLASACYWV